MYRIGSYLAPFYEKVYSSQRYWQSLYRICHETVVVVKWLADSALDGLGFVSRSLHTLFKIS